MGYGLGKNSPVVLRLGKENYEALIERHGQWVRWRTSTMCNCVNKNTFAPDLRCKKCGGRGYVYNFQKTREKWLSVMVTDESGIIELDTEYENYTLVKAYDFNGNVFNAVKTGCFINLNQSVNKSEYVNLVLTSNVEKYIKTTTVKKIADNCFMLPDLTVNKTGIDGLYYRVPCDIVSIGTISDSNGTEYKVKELRQNTFFIESDSNIDDLIVSDITYVEPFIFLLLSQNLNQKDLQDIVEVKGDAMLTYPYDCNVSNNDIITVLAGSFTNKEIVKRQADKFDTLAVYFVDKIIQLIGEREYKQDVDFILVGTNKIKWICEDAPANESNYSIAYNVYPTYVVKKNIPQLRTSENQRLPKKAVLKYVSTYAEMTKINRQ